MIVLTLLYIICGILLDIQNKRLSEQPIEELCIDILAIIFWPIIILYQIVLIIIDFCKGGDE